MMKSFCLLESKSGARNKARRPGGEGGHGAAKPDGVIHRYVLSRTSV
jgi:hypothetical protein